jgi:hypothetical protein
VCVATGAASDTQFQSATSQLQEQASDQSIAIAGPDANVASLQCEELSRLVHGSARIEKSEARIVPFHPRRESVRNMRPESQERGSRPALARREQGSAESCHP